MSMLKISLLFTGLFYALLYFIMPPVTDNSVSMDIVGRLIYAVSGFIIIPLVIIILWIIPLICSVIGGLIGLLTRPREKPFIAPAIRPGVTKKKY
jgi:hypothetical protein